MDTNREQKVQIPDKENNRIDLRIKNQKGYSRHPRPWFLWVFDFLDPPGESRILDLGGGSGALWFENRQRIPPGWKIALLDIEPAILRSAQVRFAETLAAEPPGTFLSDGQALPYASDSFDSTIAAGVLDLLANTVSALEEMRRTLRPGGQFVATVGGKGHLHELKNLLRPYLPTGGSKILGGDEDRFGIENGARQLEPFFEEITFHDYQDQMFFTSLQPILDFVLSEQFVAEHMTLNNLADFVARIKQRLEKYGQISVTVRKGLFTARKI